MPNTILFVDDEPNVTYALKRAFRKECYKVLTANSAEEAFGILKKENVDVIVSDEKMPGMQGSEFLSIVKKRYPDSVRIILTGQASIDAAIRAINEGEIYRFLTKPCNEVDLLVTIKQAIQQKELLKKTNRLLNISKKQSNLLDQLEQTHPGILDVKRDDKNVIVLEENPSTYEEILQEIGIEIKKSQRRF